MLDPQIFKRITNKFGSPEIDLFASRLNKQYAKYSSWRPDPEALFVDAFSVNWNNLFFYAFPPFSLIGRCLEKIHANQAEGILIVPQWMSQSWYPKLLRLLVEVPIVIQPKKDLLVLLGTQQLHPLWEKLTLLACHLSGNSTKTEVFLRKTNDIIMHSWRDLSHKQYDVHIRKWILFCSARKIDPIYTNITDALEFLATMFDQKLSYSSINSARSALSTILQTSSNCNYTFGEHPEIKRFMKGVYQNTPPMPRYNKTWDDNVVLQYLRGMGKATELSIKELTLKLVILIAITSTCREQTTHLLDLKGLVKENNCFVFIIDSNIKQSRPTSSLSDCIVKFKAYPLEEKLSVFHTCSVYIEKTSPLIVFTSPSMGFLMSQQ